MTEYNDYADDQKHTLDINQFTLREHEVAEFIVCYYPWQRCQHDKQFATVMCHWSDDAPFTVTRGQINHTQRFSRQLHVDGTQMFDEFGKVTTFEYNTVVRCPKCGKFDTLTTKQLAYGDLTTCSNPECDYEDYYDIGD